MRTRHEDEIAAIAVHGVPVHLAFSWNRGLAAHLSRRGVSDRRDLLAAAYSAAIPLQVGDLTMGRCSDRLASLRGRSCLQSGRDQERSRLRADGVRRLLCLDAGRETIAPLVSGGVGWIRRDFGFGAARRGSPKGRMAIRRVLRRRRRGQQLSRHGRARSHVDGGAVWASTFEQVVGCFWVCPSWRLPCYPLNVLCGRRSGCRLHWFALGFGKSAQSRSARFAWR